MPRRNLTLLALALAVMLLCISRAERNPYARYASRGYRLIDDLALEAPSDHDLLAGAMQGMVAVLRSRGDEHSAYIEPRHAKPLLTEMRQEFGGIGVRIQLKEPDETEPDAKPRLVVVEPPEPGTPAFHGGVLAGDEIVAVNEKTIVGMPLVEVLSRMRGVAGKPLTLTLRRQEEAELLTVRLVREVILLPSILGDQRLSDGGWQFRMEQDDRLALIRLTTFGNRTVEELAERLALLQEGGVRAIVLDLRNNPGGALDAAVGVSDLFLPADKQVLSTRGRNGEVLELYPTNDEESFKELSVVVLIDRNTASAAEIVAACLQDHDRAVVIGERSFGKGTVQQLLSLEAGHSLLKLTSASYWRPSGVNIHRLPDTPESETWGVSPHDGMVVAQTEEEIEAWGKWRRERDLLAEKNPKEKPESPATADRVLEKAIEYLQAQLAD